jgi:hypothetical protein
LSASWKTTGTTEPTASPSMVNDRLLVPGTVTTRPPAAGALFRTVKCATDVSLTPSAWLFESAESAKVT